MKYLLAYTIPLTAFLGIYYQGIASYAGVIFAFGFIPILEILLPVNTENYSEEEVKSRLTGFR